MKNVLLQLRSIFDFENKKKKLEKLNKEINDKDFWNNPQNAQKVSIEASTTEKLILSLKNLETNLKDIKELVDITDEENLEENDFLDEFTILCSNIDDINKEQCIFNLVNWFRDDELSVISRNRSISRFKAGYKFICHQFKNNYSRISPRYWFRFTISNINLLTLLFIKSIYKKIRL